MLLTDEDGCHLLHIHSELRQLLAYKELNKAALQQCLTALETHSDVITTAYRRYVTVR